MEKIKIEKPCMVDYNSMSPLSDGKFCAVCNTKVVDFTQMSLDEIKHYFTNHSSETICGRYQTKHSNNNWWFNFLNSIESVFYKTKFRKAAFYTITLLLFLTGTQSCFMGKRAEPKPKLDKKTAENIKPSTGSKSI